MGAGVNDSVVSENQRQSKYKRFKGGEIQTAELGWGEVLRECQKPRGKKHAGRETSFTWRHKDQPPGHQWGLVDL